MTSFERLSVSPAMSALSLSVPARRDQLPVLRAMTRTVAAQYALSMDALADLVLAVDEAANTLVSHARSTTSMVCAFDSATGPERLRLSLTAITSSPVDSSTSSFGWFVLQTLGDRVALHQDAVGAITDDQSVTITLEKALQVG